MCRSWRKWQKLPNATYAKQSLVRMKTAFYIFSSLALSWTLVSGQTTTEEVDARTVGLLPLQRQGVIVQPGEQNPFGFPKQVKKEASVNKAQYSEEDQIRDVLSSLQVRGVIGGGRIVLLGDLILEEGEFVDDVLPGQLERLLVKEITDSMITIEWVEEFKRKVPRDMKIPIDMTTRVEALLKGQVNNQQKRMGTVRNLRGEDEAVASEEDMDAR